MNLVHPEDAALFGDLQMSFGEGDDLRRYRVDRLDAAGRVAVSVRARGRWELVAVGRQTPRGELRCEGLPRQVRLGLGRALHEALAKGGRARARRAREARRAALEADLWRREIDAREGDYLPFDAPIPALPVANDAASTLAEPIRAIKPHEAAAARRRAEGATGPGLARTRPGERRERLRQVSGD